MASVNGPSLPRTTRVVDKSSLANHTHVRALEAVWSAQLRFDSSTIDARVDYIFSCTRAIDGVDARVDLDTRALTIRNVNVNGEGTGNTRCVCLS